MTISTTIKSIQDIMRKDAGVDGDAQRIQSMTEFKHIIGRGTRINDDYHKHWFTILDFKKATELFASPTAIGGSSCCFIELGIFS